MTTSKLLKKFCAENGRAVFTKAERESYLHLCAELNRIQKHYVGIESGAARREAQAARNRYTADPSDANHVKLREIEINWMAKDSENQKQRSFVSGNIRRLSTEGCKTLLPALLRRAANYLAWLAVQEDWQERQRHAAWEAPYSQSAINNSIVFQLSTVRHQAGLVEHAQFIWNGMPASVPACEWLPDLVDLAGDVWDCATLDPLAKRGSDKWRNIGQVGSPLFVPVLAESGHDANTAQIGTVKKYPAGAEKVAALFPV